MQFSSIIRAIARSSLTSELLAKLQRHHQLQLNGVGRLPKGLVASAFAQQQQQHLFVITATLEEAGRWATQLEAMGWDTVHFYPTSEASPYESFESEELTWGQMQVLSDLVKYKHFSPTVTNNNLPNNSPKKIAIVSTERALQTHLPPVEKFAEYCLTFHLGINWSSKALDETLAKLGYERVTLVETEGQWTRRGDIVDIFPVAAELPVRLEWFGDELEKMREFDPSTQRSLDQIDQLILTPTSFSSIILGNLPPDFPVPDQENVNALKTFNQLPRGRSLLGFAFPQPASLLDYLPENTLVALDEPEQCAAHSDRWLDHVEEHWQIQNQALKNIGQITSELPKIHRDFSASLGDTQRHNLLYLSELEKDVTNAEIPAINLASRPVPIFPHQFAKLAEIVRGEISRKFAVFIISAQPSRSISLLQEHDCPGQFIPNPCDYRAIEKLIDTHRIPVGLKYSGLAEMAGFILPTFRLVVITDREFYGQHTLATSTYVLKRRQATSKQVDPNKLRPGDYVVHRHHGIGKFLKLETLQNREYLVLKYADGLLRVPVDQMGAVSRFRATENKEPQLNKLTGKAWEATKNKVRKSIKKLAVDLLQLYAKRAEQKGFAYPPDMPWQAELEESFAYQPTPDQLKAIQDVKRDLESDRPMDRLVCGDVGFGKTEVAIRAIFKAVTAGKQVAMLAPTTILTQQHYHTLKERFAPYPINVGLLNRFRSDAEKKEILERLKTGELDVIVGTHQILSKSVKFRDLGLLVIDEEQRFGVNQKEKIKSLKTQVDVLTLSATPIPRTLYMSLSGIREMSLILTPPPARRPIQTHLCPYNLETVRSAIRQELDRGGQVFYVVPRIEGIEAVGANLRQMVPSARIAIAHGQMAAEELEAIMLSFSAGDADILVCTTIIESGLDIPRVNTILIEDAHRFGLAQLYQLRGRVGRSGIQAHAWMFYPESGIGSLTEAATKRLRAIQEFTQLGSGYQLAMRDMEIRGVGNLLGAEQSGQMNVIGFDLYMEMLEEAIREIRGQAIPQVDDTEIKLPVMAFIPADYIQDLEQKISAYRALAAAESKKELSLIAAEWSDRYGPIPPSAQQLFRVIELKQLAKKLGFSRIIPEGKQHVVLETPMLEPAWNLLKENLPKTVHDRFVYSPGKVTVRGLGIFAIEQQLDYLIDWFSKMQGALPEIER